MTKGQQISRGFKSVKNAKVNFFYTLLTIFAAFFSRKIFIDSLGTEFVGLTTTLQSLLGFLNLAELGVGTAIAVTLYKPVAEDNKIEINDIMSVMAYLYAIIGIIVLCSGIILSFFLSSILGNSSIPHTLLYFAYYAFLISSLFTYFFNYTQTLLSANQCNYVVVKYFQLSNVIKLIVQMYFAHAYQSMYIWVFIEFIFGIIYCIILRVKINQTYSWLNCGAKRGKKIFPKYKHIGKLLKQIFIHRIAFFTQSQLSPLFVMAYVSLNAVTYYTNYITITSKVYLLVNSLLGSTEASVGNLIAEKQVDRVYIRRVYRELVSLYFFLAAFTAVMLYYLTEPFLALWLGEQFVLSRIILILLLLEMFVRVFTSATNMFLSGFGLFNDVWASFAESGLYILLALILGKSFALQGILMAIVVSKYLNFGLWKPYFLFKKGFKRPYAEYGVLFLKLLSAFVISVFLFSFVNKFLMFNLSNFGYLILYAMVIAIIYFILFFVCMYLIAPGFKDVVSRAFYMIKSKY
ncbi:MAG TPA: sugar transporter [Coprobacter fastidiosus]|jgi:O-antigen/teichoic acid export membrane protein|uniref:Sugar transporter n=1 Tax=Coprobacter fastidiosus TaxID=1099853 RepID=A0A354M4S1_9BACT|nr:sugar transporter [Coprobacter fastidiosus]